MALCLHYRNAFFTFSCVSNYASGSSDCVQPIAGCLVGNELRSLDVPRPDVQVLHWHLLAGAEENWDNLVRVVGACLIPINSDTCLFHTQIHLYEGIVSSFVNKMCKHSSKSKNYGSNYMCKLEVFFQQVVYLAINMIRNLQLFNIVSYGSLCSLCNNKICDYELWLRLAINL